MYNENQKMAYISGRKTESSRYFCKVVFDECEVFEKEWGADLCTQSVERLSVLVNSLFSTRVKSSVPKLILLKDYVRWCIDNNINDARSDIFKVQIESVQILKEYMVSGPLGLQKKLDLVFDGVENCTIDCTYRCFYWLAFAGMQEKDILDVKKDDIILSDLTINFNGKTYPIYREAIPTIKKAITLKEFRYVNSNYANVIYKPRANPEMLLSGIKATPSIKVIRAELSRKNKCVINRLGENPNLSYQRVRLSGIFYRKFESERSGDPIDFNDLAWEKLGINPAESKYFGSLEKKQKSIEDDYMVDYMRWKAAFMV